MWSSDVFYPVTLTLHELRLIIKLINLDLLSPGLPLTHDFLRAVLETAVVSLVHWSSLQMTDDYHGFAPLVVCFDAEPSEAPVEHPLKKMKEKNNNINKKLFNNL